MCANSSRESSNRSFPLPFFEKETISFRSIIRPSNRLPPDTIIAAHDSFLTIVSQSALFSRCHFLRVNAQSEITLHAYMYIRVYNISVARQLRAVYNSILKNYLGRYGNSVRCLSLSLYFSTEKGGKMVERIGERGGGAARHDRGGHANRFIESWSVYIQIGFST